MNRSEYILRRLASALLVIMGVLVVTFFISRIVPRDPALLYAGPRARPEQIVQARIDLGLDKPLHIQFVRYVGGLIQGDLGFSYRTKRPIIKDLMIFLPATLEVVIPASSIALIVGILIGVISGARRGQGFDQVSRVLSISAVSIPIFWLALLAQLLFFGQLGWLPLGGRVESATALLHPVDSVTGFYLIDTLLTKNWVAWRDALRHLVLPVGVLASRQIGRTIRMTRAAVIDVLSETYVTTARACGLPERIIMFRLVLKNAIIPTLTVFGLTFAGSITGAVLLEVIFMWPGLGRYVTDAIVGMDFPVIIAVTLIGTIAYVVINLIVDIVQASLDPRIKLG